VDVLGTRLAWIGDGAPRMEVALTRGRRRRLTRRRANDADFFDVGRSVQRYEPLGDGVVRFASGTFTADIPFDVAGLVVHYPGIPRRAAG